MAVSGAPTKFSNIQIGDPATVGANVGDLSIAGAALIDGAARVTGVLTATAGVAITAETATSGSPSPGATLLLYKAVALTSTQILAMATPIILLAAPGAGKAIVLHRFFIRVTRTSTAYANGGNVTLEYTTGPVAATGAVAASVFTGGAGVADYAPLLIAAAPVENDSIEIIAATAFITGTGAAVAHMWYSIV